MIFKTIPDESYSITFGNFLTFDKEIAQKNIVNVNFFISSDFEKSTFSKRSFSKGLWKFSFINL